MQCAQFGALLLFWNISSCYWKMPSWRLMAKPIAEVITIRRGYSCERSQELLCMLKIAPAYFMELAAACQQLLTPLLLSLLEWAGNCHHQNMVNRDCLDSTVCAPKSNLQAHLTSDFFAWSSWWLGAILDYSSHGRPWQGDSSAVSGEERAVSWPRNHGPTGAFTVY